MLDVEDDLLDVDAAAGDGRASTVVGDGALLATLARAKSDRMRDIVATIQREQDEAIRAPAGGVTLIEGGPGTGKTAVALHRAAHLLYRDRRRFEGGGVLLVGPSPGLHVLCGAGAAVARRGDGRAALARRQSSTASPATGSTRRALAALKGSLRMRRFLQRAVREAPPDAPTELRIVYGGEVLRLSGRRPAPGTAGAAPAASTTPTRPGRRSGAALVAALWARPARGRHLDARKAFADELYDRDEFERFARAWWPMLAPAEVLGWLARRRTGCARPGGTGSRSRTATALAESWAGAPADLSVADVALLDELRALLGEPPRPDRRRGAAAAWASTSPATTSASCPQ